MLPYVQELQLLISSGVIIQTLNNVVASILFSIPLSTSTYNPYSMGVQDFLHLPPEDLSSETSAAGPIWHFGELGVTLKQEMRVAGPGRRSCVVLLPKVVRSI